MKLTSPLVGLALSVALLPAAGALSQAPPEHGTIGYHVRSGGHDLADHDWRQYIAFADRHFRAR
jgi:hypothetical protein